VELTEKAIKLIEGKNFAFLETLNSDRSPHAAPMRIDHEGDAVLADMAMRQVNQKNTSRETNESFLQ